MSSFWTACWQETPSLLGKTYRNLVICDILRSAQDEERRKVRRLHNSIVILDVLCHGGDNRQPDSYLAIGTKILLTLHNVVGARARITEPFERDLKHTDVAVRRVR